MGRKLFLIILIGMLLVGLNACGTILPGKVNYSSKLQTTIEQMRVKATILVTEDGKVLIYDEKGEPPQKRCLYPKPEMKGSEQICPAFQEGSQVKSFQDFSIFKSNSQDCVTLGPDSYGMSYVVCW